MRQIRAWWMRLSGLFRRQKLDRELADELDSHLQLHISDNLRAGMTPEQARREALLRLGGLEPVKEIYRDRRGLPGLESLLQDFRYGLRAIRKNPGFSAAAIVVLALGIGANTAIFSVVHAVLLRPLPYSDSDRLMQLWHTPPQKSFPGMKEFSLSAANFLDWQSRNRSFSDMAIYTGARFNMTGQGEPQPVDAARVTANFFSVLGVRPILGRAFLPEEDQPGRNREIILSHGFWKTRFASRGDVVGQPLALDGQNYTIVGVMGQSFEKPGWAEVWTPMAFSDQERAVRGEHHFLVIGRLKDGVSLAQAQADLDNISHQLAREYPEDDAGWGAEVKPLREETVGEVRRPLLMLLGAVAFVLLIACANVTNLILARTLGRRKEIAIRGALGASRRRLLQQVLSETVVLALAGAVVGVGIAHYGMDLIVHFLANSLPRFMVIRLDSTVLLFALAIAALSGVLAGLAPAWRLANSNTLEALKQGMGRVSSDAGSSRTRNALVVSEVALSLVLLVGAGLMVRSLWALRAVDTGFDPRNVLTMEPSTPATKYPTPVAQSNATNSMLDRIRALPGVESAASIDSLPIADSGSTQPIAIEGRPAQAMSEQPEASVRVITPGYLQTMRIRLVRGRDFSDTDSPTAPFVVLVSESLARRFWPNEDPIGRHLTLSFYPGRVRTVVGVIGDIKLFSLEDGESHGALYFPVAQMTTPLYGGWRSFSPSIVLRTSGDPASVGPAAVNAIHQVDASTPVLHVVTMDGLLADSLTQKRFTMLLLATFAGLALLLAGVGIYSVLAYSVRRRTQEIGIRMALGAQIDDVLKMVILEGMRPTLIGLALGLMGALALGRFIATLIFGVKPTDLPTFAAVCVLLAAVGLFASAIPAWRASRVDPMRTLRNE